MANNVTFDTDDEDDDFPRRSKPQRKGDFRANGNASHRRAVSLIEREALNLKHGQRPR